MRVPLPLIMAAVILPMAIITFNTTQASTDIIYSYDRDYTRILSLNPVRYNVTYPTTVTQYHMYYIPPGSIEAMENRLFALAGFKSTIGTHTVLSCRTDQVSPNSPYLYLIPTLVNPNAFSSSVLYNITIQPGCNVLVRRSLQNFDIFIPLSDSSWVVIRHVIINYYSGRGFYTFSSGTGLCGSTINNRVVRYVILRNGYYICATAQTRPLSEIFDVATYSIPDNPIPPIRTVTSGVPSPIEFYVPFIYREVANQRVVVVIRG